MKSKMTVKDYCYLGAMCRLIDDMLCTELSRYRKKISKEAARAIYANLLKFRDLKNMLENEMLSDYADNEATWTDYFSVFHGTFDGTPINDTDQMVRDLAVAYADSLATSIEHEAKTGVKGAPASAFKSIPINTLLALDALAGEN